MKLNAKYTVFSLITLASIYVLYHNERFLIDSSNPAWQRYEAFKWWVVFADISIHWKEICAAFTAPAKSGVTPAPIRSGVTAKIAKPRLPKNAIGAT